MPVYKGDPTKNKRVWYFSLYYTTLNGERKKYKSKKFTTKDEALREEALFRTSKAESIKQSLTFGELYNEYYSFSKSRIKERSLINYDNALQLHVIPFFKDKKIDKINIKDIMKWQDEINQTNLATETKQLIHTLFSSVMKYAIKYHGLSNNVLSIVGNFKSKSEMKKEMNF